MLCYIQLTKHAKLILKPGESQEPPATLAAELCSDSDYAGDKTRRKSTIGVVAMLCGSAIAWQSKLQRIVAQSSMEAEYVVMA
jgi:hypothetical protein